MTDTQTKWRPDSQQREILEALLSESKKEKSQAEFARKYLVISPERLSKIFAALDDDGDRRSYFDEIRNPDALMDELSRDLDSVKIRRAREALMETVAVLKTSKHEKIVTAVRQCRKKRDENRLVVFKAPTGGGKSLLGKRLEREFGAKVVQSRRSWRKSESAFLRDVSEAVGLDVGGEMRPDILQDEMENFLVLNPLVLVFDECEYFGAPSLSGLKRLLNRTHITIVVAIIPQDHTKWKQYYPTEAAQLERRQHAWFQQSAIDPDDVRLFFPTNQFDDPKSAFDHIAHNASRFGHFTLVQIVAELLDGKKGISEAEVKKAVKDALGRLSRSSSEENSKET